MTQVNKNLIETFPKLPSNYRWKVEAASSYPNIVSVWLQKRNRFGFWTNVSYGAGAVNGAYGYLTPLGKAKVMYDVNLGANSILGVTQK